MKQTRILYPVLNFPTCSFLNSQQKGIPTAGLRYLLYCADNFRGVCVCVCVCVCVRARACGQPEIQYVKLNTNKQAYYYK